MFPIFYNELENSSCQISKFDVIRWRRIVSRPFKNCVKTFAEKSIERFAADFTEKHYQ